MIKNWCFAFDGVNSNIFNDAAAGASLTLYGATDQGQDTLSIRGSGLTGKLLAGTVFIIDGTRYTVSQDTAAASGSGTTKTISGIHTVEEIQDHSSGATVTLDSLGLWLQECPIMGEAVPRFQTYEVPGRNGTLHIYDGSYKNRSITIRCWGYVADSLNLVDRVNALLFTSTDYRRLTINGETDAYWMARPTGSVTVEKINKNVVALSFQFDVMPQHFLVSGDTWKIFASSGTITNPSGFSCKPLIRCARSGSTWSGTGFNIGGVTFSVLTTAPSVFTYDAADGICRNSSGTIISPAVSSAKNAEIPDGTSSITLSGSHWSSFGVLPRWFKL